MAIAIHPENAKLVRQAITSAVAPTARIDIDGTLAGTDTDSEATAINNARVVNMAAGGHIHQTAQSNPAVVTPPSLRQTGILPPTGLKENAGEFTGSELSLSSEGLSEWEDVVLPEEEEVGLGEAELRRNETKRSSRFGVSRPALARGTFGRRRSVLRCRLPSPRRLYRRGTPCDAVLSRGSPRGFLAA
ncbi:hypothetical protein SKAU_G00356070 [Synaphobranchus kaupii]|uniref:Uncharacterized protein n=1 Tax=Synaphobranchus kaupii TaxID=118154 RepID=A0A9Q1IGL9_SYNKA|nr:hypothetical protein SKAU_G00356070 [Synaphobranchus kaupii]